MSVDQDKTAVGSFFAKVEAIDREVAATIEKEASDILKRGAASGDNVLLDTAADALATAKALKAGIKVAPKVIAATKRGNLTLIIRDAPLDD